jgi:hypothetical protein
MEYLVKRYNTTRAGDEDEQGNGKLTGTWYASIDTLQQTRMRPG